MTPEWILFLLLSSNSFALQPGPPASTGRAGGVFAPGVLYCTNPGQTNCTQPGGTAQAAKPNVDASATSAQQPQLPQPENKNNDMMQKLAPLASMLGGGMPRGGGGGGGGRPYSGQQSPST